MFNGLPPVALTGSVWQILGDSSAFGLVIISILVLMSIVSWMIILIKWRQFRTIRHDSDRFLTFYRRSGRLSDSQGQAKVCAGSPLAQIFASGYDEVTQLAERRGGSNPGSAQGYTLDDKDYDILEMTMEKSLTDEVGKLEKKSVFLATTASSAPFLGLLGTVVGIMDSFWSIGERGSASLAIVAPGIAEALLATIIGLGAAIPAVIAFNWANNRTKAISDQAFSFILDFITRVKKESR